MAAAAVKSTINKALSSLSIIDSTPEPTAEAVQALRAQFEAVDQGHLFTFWDELTTAEKATLFAQLSKFEPERVAVHLPLLSPRDPEADISPA